MNDNNLRDIADPFKNLWNGFVDFLPDFVVAVILLVVGWIIATAISKLVKSILVSAKVDELGDKAGLAEVSSRTGVKMSIAGTIAWLIKWFLLVGIFLVAADRLGLTQVADFLRDVLDYIPRVVAAAAILLAGLMIGRFLARVVRGSVAAAGIASADLIGAVVQWGIVVFTVLAALQQLGIAGSLIGTLFTGFVYMIALAGGLAFGLGGREHATRVLNKIERDVKS